MISGFGLRDEMNNMYNDNFIILMLFAQLRTALRDVILSQWRHLHLGTGLIYNHTSNGKQRARYQRDID